MNLNGKRALVLGLGMSGLAMARWCVRRGARVRVADTRTTPPFLAQLQREIADAEFITADFLKSPAKSLLEGVDLVALSPGLSGGLLLLLEARARGIPVLGEIELFAQALSDLGVRAKTRVIAITGTNGKTTTTALTGHLCRGAGYDAEVAGNIAPAALDALSARLDAGRLPDVWVLELSSFQLETLSSLDADAATVLNISDDHLDRYVNVQEYGEAKARIFAGDGVQVLNRDDPRVKKMALAGRRLITFGLDAPGMDEDFGLRMNRGEPWLMQGDRYLLAQPQLPIGGIHNAANALAALALCHAIGLPQASLVSGLRSFQGLPHRTQRIAEIAGVTYYDDSKGTNVGATVAALDAIGAAHASDNGGREDSHKIVLIAGGEGKGQDFSPLREAVVKYGRAVILIGRDAPRIEAVLAGTAVALEHAVDMAAAVRTAARLAVSGDAVLLSPACASMDMYRDYAHRAEVFAAAVATLGATGVATESAS